MTKTSKALITSAAIAGLLAGTGAAVQASTVLTTAKSSLSALQDKDKKDDTKVAEKHACKGQNSCKGKGWESRTAEQCKKEGGKVLKM